MSDHTGLKRCPFCGGEAKTVEYKVYSYVRVVCQDCGAASKNVEYSAYYTAADRAKELWNRRVEDGKILRQTVL